MSDSLAIEPFSKDDELVMLVSKYLDQQLSDDETKRLEDRLQSDPVAMRYCAEQISLHTRLRMLSKPLRINIHEGRDLEIRQHADQAIFTTKTVNKITIGSRPLITEAIAVAVNPEKKSSLSRWLAVLPLVALICVGFYLWSRESKIVDQHWELLPLDNTSFEDGEADEGERTRNIPGWKLRPNPEATVILNPSNTGETNKYGGAHLVKAYSEIDGRNVLVLNRTSNGEIGWVKQGLFSRAADGTEAAIGLGELNNKTIRVKMLVGRAQKEAGHWINPVNLKVSIQEFEKPYRSIAEYRIDTGSSKWEAADVDLALDYDQFKEVSFDLKIEPKQMRGDAYLVIEVDLSTAKEAELYIDNIQLRLDQ